LKGFPKPEICATITLYRSSGGITWCPSRKTLLTGSKQKGDNLYRCAGKSNGTPSNREQEINMASIAYVDGTGNVRQRDITASSAGTTASPDVFTVSVVNTELSAVGLQADTAATSNTGSFSLISLFKRFLNAFTRPAIVYSNATLANTTGTDIVAAPVTSNTAVYITHLIFQNIDATTTTINVRSGTTTILSIVLPQNSVYSVTFPERRELALTANTAFNLQATTANAIVYSVGYYTGAA